MIIYLLKVIACSGLLLAFYYAVLQQDKLFRFNRFFLLAIVILSLSIPVTTIRTKTVEVPVMTQAPNHVANAIPHDVPANMDTDSLAEVDIPESYIDWETVLLAIYVLVAFGLLLRFCTNLRALTKLKRQAKIVRHHGVNIVLRSDIHSSFSFFNHIYTNRERYENGQLPPEIITHEKAHIDELHSLDIVALELIHCILWFNPFIYFLKKAIKLNHEYLADARVIHSKPDPSGYQKMLINYARRQYQSEPALVSNLNYGLTKKRLKMMTKDKNRLKSMLRQVAAFLIIAGTFWILGATKIIAQEVGSETDLNLKVNTDLNINSEISTDIDRNTKIDLDLQVQDTIKVTKIKQDKRPTKLQRFGVYIAPTSKSKVRFKNEAGELIEKRYGELTKAELKRFKSKDSEAEYYRVAPPIRKITQAQLNDFLDTEKYGVWIDDRRVENSALNQYKPEDIYDFRQSKLKKNAANYGKHEYQIDIATNEYAEKQTYFKSGWLPYTLPTVKIIEVKPKVKNSGNEASLQKGKPMIREIKVKDKAKTKDKPVIREVKMKDKAKTKDKSSHQEKDGFVGKSNWKKGDQIPPELLAKLDLDQVKHMLASTFSTWLKYKSPNGQVVVKTYR